MDLVPEFKLEAKVALKPNANLGKIDDIKLDSEYISNTEETETKDDDGSINPKNDSDEK